MGWLKYFCSIFSRLCKDIGKPEITVYLHDTYWVEDKLSMLPNYTPDKRKPLDSNYYSVTLEDFDKMRNYDKTNLRPYITDRFDCDDYGMLFKANMAKEFGINTVAWVIDYSAGHSYNLVLLEDVEEPLIFEPQTDQLIRIGERDLNLYKLEDYLVII